jgi:RNA polymerase sigma-70 factor (ECF subfamily)
MCLALMTCMASQTARVASAHVRLPRLAPLPAEAAIPSEEERPTPPLDANAFERIVKENHARILRLALGMLRDPDLADDVAQETFLRAFRFYKSFRNDAALFTWLYRIATNLCIDAQRKRGRTTEQFEDLEGDAEPADPSPTPEHTFEIRELAKQTEAALEALSPNHRAILLLREVEGLSYEQIARVLHIPKGTVMSRLFHARSNLQRAALTLAG